ncbi:glycosyltransferase family protein [Azospirillum agricola]|uniref:glycosyltransferase family protein n=1 Tax=Azospirillum agricola TaxID=1720247 RepID=UPI000A0EFA2E|nr:glycosyltransferase [Azospirillum agricola]SMH41553.1 Glycosyl transferases group 1 [Azospirillum lipoferum]
MIKILFFNPEQYVDFENEPSNIQLRLPILNCSLPIEHRDCVYQRDLRAHGRAEMDRRALAAVAEFRPDLVIYSATWEHENLSPGVLKAIRDGGTPVVSMLWDSWIEPTTAEAELLGSSSILVVGDSLHTYLRCRTVAERLTPQTRIVFFGGQVFTDLLRPLPDEPKQFDVTLLGSNEGDRARLVDYLTEELPKRGIRFNKAGGLVNSRKGAFKLTDDWVSWEEYVRIINRSSLCLNSRTDPARVQIKGKIFDYMACRVACLTDANVETRRFIPDGAAALFDGHEECLAQILRLLGDDAERERIAAAGHRWLTETFGYQAFWSGILRTALGDGGCLPTLPILEDEYARVHASRSALLRHELAGGARLAAISFSGVPQRMPVTWANRRNGFQRMMLEDGTCIASNRMPVDIVRLDDDLLLISDTFGRVALGNGWVFGYGGAAATAAPDLEYLNAAIDEFTRRNADSPATGKA